MQRAETYPPIQIRSVERLKDKYLLHCISNTFANVKYIFQKYFILCISDVFYPALPKMQCSRRQTVAKTLNLSLEARTHQGTKYLLQRSRPRDWTERY